MYLHSESQLELKLYESALGCIAPGPGLYRYWSNKMSPARGLYLARAVKIFIPFTAGCESTLHEKAPASGYKDICLELKELHAFEDNS